MKRVIYKLTVFILMISLLVPSLVGCAKEDDATLLTVAQELLEKSNAVNKICFGEGLTKSEDGYKLSGYSEVTAEDREKYRLATVEDIRALVREVYSVAACGYIDSVVFSPVQTESGYVSYRRYFDATENDIIHLMVKNEYEPLTTGDVTYENVRVASHKKSRAEILVDITVTDGSETRTDKDVMLSLRKEGGAWRFDTVTYSSIK